MQNWKYELGYENREVVNPESINLEELKTDMDMITAYLELIKARHHGDSVKNNHGTVANEKSKTIVDDVRHRLERVGWHVHIFSNGSVHDRCDVDFYLHDGLGNIKVSEVPFSSESNIDILEKELFNDDGSLRHVTETLAMLKARIGLKVLDLGEMVENEEITEETKETVMAIMKEQGLEEIHEIDEDNRTFTSGSQEWTWMNSEEEAEALAREYLEDGEIWRMQVEAEETTDSLDDWIDQVLSSDGWQSELCRYDGQSYDLPDGKVYWRTN